MRMCQLALLRAAKLQVARPPQRTRQQRGGHFRPVCLRRAKARLSCRSLSHRRGSVGSIATDGKGVAEGRDSRASSSALELVTDNILESREVMAIDDPDADAKLELKAEFSEVR